MELRRKNIFSMLVYTVVVLKACAGLQSKTDNCGPLDWKPFGDYKCFKLMPPTTTAGHLLTYNQAAALCRNQNSRSTLPSITSASEHNFIAGLTPSGENLWLGGQIINSSLHWDDENLVHGIEYTNWSDHINIPPNRTHCFQSEDSLSTHGHGKWNIYGCNRKYLVALVCQKPQSWDPFKIQAILQRHLHSVEFEFKEYEQEIVDLRQKVENHQINFDNLNRELESLNKTAPTNSSVPVGFVYVQYKDQPEPGTIWPGYTWTDVSSNFAGQFFRAVGGNSGSFGSTQSENVPKITTVTYLDSSGHPTVININYGGTTGAVLSGLYGSDQVGLVFTATGGEVRPYNSAVKIWKRTR